MWSPSYDSCRRCGEQTPSHTAYICRVCPRCGWSYEPSPDPDAWTSDCRSHRYTVASLTSRTIKRDAFRWTETKCIVFTSVMFSTQHFPTWVRDHVALQLICRDELFITRMAVKYFVYLGQKSKQELAVSVLLIISITCLLEDQSLRWSTDTKSCLFSLDRCLETQKCWEVSVLFLLWSVTPVISHSIPPRRPATIAYANAKKLLLSRLLLQSLFS